MELFKKRIHNKDFHFNVEENLEVQLNTLTDIFRTIEESKLNNNFSVQVGFSTYYLEEISLNTFVVKTNDLVNDPFQKKTEDLTLALWIQLEQGHLLRTLDIVGDDICFFDKIILSKDILSKNDMYLQRSSDVEKGDSGWFIGDVKNDNNNLNAIYAFELLKEKPELIKYLALPNEYMIIIENNSVKAILKGEDINILS